MKTIQSIDDITKASDTVSLPSIDVRQNVMQKIYRRKENKRMIRGKKLSVAIIAGIFMVLAVGFTVAKVWELNGPGGNKFKYSLFNDGMSKISSQQLEIINSQWQSLKPGGVIAVLKTKDNPKNLITVSSKPIIFTGLNELKEKVGSSFIAPTFIPDGYSFKEGQLQSGVNASIREEMLKEMREEGDKAKKDVIIKVLEPSGNVDSYSITYQDRNEKNQIDVSLYFNFEGNEFSQPDNGQNVDKIKVSDFEAIYVKDKGRTDIKWIDSSKHILYSVGCPGENVSKDELLKIAESLK